LVKSSVGSPCGTTGALGTILCSLLLKKSKNCSLISFDVIVLSHFFKWRKYKKIAQGFQRSAVGEQPFFAQNYKN